MNYLGEIIAFQSWMEANPTPPAAQALWSCLMNVNYKCRWIEWFSCANTILMGKMGVNSDKTLDNARNFLMEKGRIQYIPGGNRKIAGRYRLISLLQSSIVNNTAVKGIETSTIPETTVKPMVEGGAIKKQSEPATKTNKIKPVPEPGKLQGEIVDITKILDYYLRIAKKDMESGSDRSFALELCKTEGMTFEYIKQGIDKCIDKFKGRYRGERMPFVYCKPAIFQIYQAAQERGKLSGGVKRDTEPSNEKSKGAAIDERTRRLIDPEKDGNIGDTNCDY